MFLQEVSTLLDRFIHFDIVMCSDFNCPGVHKGDIDFRLAQMASDNNFIQHNTGPTNVGRNLLDLLFTYDEGIKVESVCVTDEEVADHFMASCTLTIDRLEEQVKTTQSRKLSNLDPALFASNFLMNYVAIQSCADADEYCDALLHSLHVTLDAMAPLCTLKSS